MWYTQSSNCGSLGGPLICWSIVKTEDKFVIDLSEGNNKPNDILFGLKQKFEGNRSTIKTIYNARMKNRVNERDGRSKMQQLMFKLKEHGYYFHDRRCEKTNTVKDLFIAYPTSIDLLWCFLNVIFMDCTYKTNRYRLPLLEIVGVTSTQMTFSIAAAYLEFEREDNYMWACTILQSLMHQSSLPIVIVTVREKALMNALERTFPSSRNFLCQWHINRNVLANCKKMLGLKKKWDAFNLYWNVLVIAANEATFEDAVNKLHSEFKEYPAAVKYVMDQWVVPYKERFVACWTDNVMHYDNNTTNRVESHHSLLKRQLGSSQGNFETCWRQIHTFIETSHVAIKESFEKSKNVVQHKYKSIIFRLLQGMVSMDALNKIYDKMIGIPETGVNPLLCLCTLRKTCGLPCAHEIDEYVRLDELIPLDKVDAFWRKLDMVPSKGDDIGVGEEIVDRWSQLFVNLNSKFHRALESIRLSMLKRLIEVDNSVTTTLITLSPEVQTHAKGRPKTVKTKQSKSTKWDSSKFEYVESIKDSCSPSPCDQLVTYEVGQSNEPSMFTKTSKTKMQVVHRKTRLGKATDFMTQQLAHLYEYIVSTKNVIGDGHCGFHAVADLLVFTEESCGRVRGDLHNELTINKELYSRVFNEIGRIDKVLKILDFYEMSAPKKHSFVCPEMGYLVASAYNVYLVCLDKRMSLTYLPLRTEVPSNPKVICITFVNRDYYIEVFLREGHPSPPVATMWYTFRHKCAAGWKNIYSQQLDMYSVSIGNSRVGRSGETIALDK